MILSGGCARATHQRSAGVEITGVSRKPVRLALVRLEERPAAGDPSGGFMVKAFTEREFWIRSAARHAGRPGRTFRRARRSARSLEPLKECLADLDQLVRQDPISVEAFSAYVTMNARFHALLNDSASPPLIREIDPRLRAAVRLPQRVRDGESALPEAHHILLIGQDHHRTWSTRSRTAKARAPKP